MFFSPLFPSFPSSNFSKAARAISLEEIAFLDSWNVDPRIEVAEIEAWDSRPLAGCRNDKTTRKSPERFAPNWKMENATFSGQLKWVVATQIFVYFHPEPWGDDPIWRAYFSKGLKPQTSSGTLR